MTKCDCADIVCADICQWKQCGRKKKKKTKPFEPSKQVFTAGSQEPIIIPKGTKKITYILIGAGGNGGPAVIDINTILVCGGGGGGGDIVVNEIDVINGLTYQVGIPSNKPSKLFYANLSEVDQAVGGNDGDVGIGGTGGGSVGAPGGNGNTGDGPSNGGDQQSIYDLYPQLLPYEYLLQDTLSPSGVTGGQSGYAGGGAAGIANLLNINATNGSTDIILGGYGGLGIGAGGGGNAVLGSDLGTGAPGIVILIYH